MFITYLLRELRRRMRQAIFIAAGLALGVGLVITVTAASAGVSATQGTVLHSLYGVGTDVTVTRSPTAGSGEGTRFNFAGGAGGQQSSGTTFSRDSSGTITSGHNFTTAQSDSNVAVVDSNYAQAQNLKVGSTVTVAGKTFTVIGIVQVE